MGLPVYKTTKGGANSTARDTLDHLAQDGHSIAATLVRWRTVSKMYTTYLAPDSKLVQAIYPWGHLHPSFNVVGTDTGRLSSSGPNAQNFPRNSDETYNFRKSFIADPGYSLVGGDYSQIELRIMAHMSQCQAMMDEYRKDYELQQAIMRGDDIKAMLKAGLFTKSDIHQKTADACRCSRQLAKNINFGLLYGMGAEKLALVLTEANWDACVEKGRTWDPACDVVTKELAKEFIDLFFGMYPEIRHYQKAVGEYAKRNGNVRTRYGQLRRLPDVYASDPYLVHAACRQAVNTTIQGHVGELMLHCMNRIERDEELRDYGFRMFLQVHDELLGEVPHKWVKPTQIKLAKILQMPSESTDAFMHYGYRVPLVFEPCAGPDWATVH
jgi:DNA polymerase-1